MDLFFSSLHHIYLSERRHLSGEVADHRPIISPAKSPPPTTSSSPFLLSVRSNLFSSPTLIFQFFLA
ncbi:hypothetical protein L484_006843 [Morus notabilis]|uniref:Uncharacterized protein n=1 Tax=Morus notabilis TaxID=981085 RepID=W9R5V0_9ROSA|nr:hypothetical protein L484_006843 [Morus notabilis]